MSNWDTPPGGLTSDERRGQRRRRIKSAIAGLLVMTLVMGFARANLLESDPVSEAEALKEFRASTGGDASTVGDRRRGSKERGSSVSRRRPSVVAQATPSHGVPRAAPPSTPSEDRNVVEGDPSEKGHAEREPARPREGVYTWTIEGYEEASGGTRRELPERSHRIITHGDRGTWTEHHIFSNKRETWFHLDSSSSGSSTTAVRNRIEFTPVVVDRTVTFDPPVRSTRLPFQLNETWSGRWEGRTEGDYDARIFEHTYIVIEGEKVEVWGSEVTMRMRGEVDGVVVTRSWIAPAYDMVVRQYQRMDVESGPGAYRSEWTGQVTSLTPSQ